MPSSYSHHYVANNKFFVPQYLNTIHPAHPKTVMHLPNKKQSCLFLSIAMAQATDALAPGGTCVLIGVPETGATVPLDVRPIVTGERVIRGCSYGSARTREDLPRLATLYQAGKLKIDELINRRYGLDEANEAFRALAAGELARGLIVFS